MLRPRPECLQQRRGPFSWDAHDAEYVGLRIEDEQSRHARVIVTDQLPAEEDADLV
ncbi:hypothetical protein SSTU70S_05205 [Stutzerimonas stutzeri]